MGKFRTKIKGQSKGKRWPKGQSANSNPATHKFRDQARSCFFQPNLDGSNKSSLTSEALLKHDAIQLYTTTPMDLEQQQQQHEEVEETFTTISGSTSNGTLTTSKTFASEWSDCTNISFKRFLNVFQPKSLVHKEMLAILAAITEVIKENNGTESSTEYYCALLTTLEQIYNNKDNDNDNSSNEEQLTAVLSLINMGIKTVPDSVLKLNFNDVATKMLHILKDYINSNNNIIVKAILNILAVLLAKQELAIWNHDLTRQIFDIILNPFAVHTKPKWRKAAQESIALIVQSDYFKTDNSNLAADYVAEFCELTLNKCMGCNDTNTVILSTIQTTGQTTILHILGLMKETICYFTKNHMKRCCEILLRLMTLNYPIVTSCSLQVLHSLFSSPKPVVASKLNAQLITALYEYQPSINDIQPMLAWMLVMQQAHVHLTDVDVGMACQLLPKIFTTITQLWLTDKHEIQTNVTHTLEILFKDAVQTVCLNQDYLQKYQQKIEKCFNTIIQGLNYQYYQVWHQVLHLISIIFEISGGNCRDYFVDCLKQLAELRDSYKFSYNNELEHTIGIAIRTFGPEFVLNYIHLTKTSDDDDLIIINLDRSWLLPILKENIKHSTLEYFYKNILQLAINCQKKSQKLAELNDGIGSHSYELFSIQLWNLLPSFCNQPTDIKENFKNLAKFLGITLQDKKELRLCIMASIRKLIKISQELKHTDDIEELSKYDKNYLPILFNLYTIKPMGSDEEGQRLACLDTIKIYLTIAKDELRQQLFLNALQRLNITTQDPEDYFIKEGILDLIRVLIKYQNVENLSKLYEQHVLPNIKQQQQQKGSKTTSNNHNKKEQKKAYRLLEEICKNFQESCNCQQFIKKNHKQIEKLLNNSLNNCIISSKGARLKCYNYLIQSQQENLDKNSKLIKTIIPEIILSCKDINEKTRKISYELLNLIGELLLKHNQIDDFIKMIVVGLIGNTQMITCTILGIASVLHNFSGSLGHENIRLLLENITVLIKSPTREIVAASLSFINVYTKVLPSPLVGSTLPAIITSICCICDDSKRHFRIKLRNILDRLIRKFGYESIIRHVPVNDVIMYKRLRNLRKLNVRKKKLKETKDKKEQNDDDVSGGGGGGDDNDDVEDEFLIKSKPKNVDDILADLDSDDDNDDLLDDDNDDDVDYKKKTRKQKTWIEEGSDSIIDFTDPTTVSRITATKPSSSNTKTAPNNNNPKKNKDSGFKTASDGRLIIQDMSDNDSDNDDKLKFKFNPSDSDTDDDDDDKKSIAETLLLSNRKRKRSAASVKSGTSNFSQSLPSKYKPGGVGIHRPTKALSVKSGHSTATSIKTGTEYTSKKAKGDVKRKGSKLDPYAYLPLNRSLINKRKKMKAAGTFKHIVNAAKVGALKGSKAKKNLLKRKV